MNNKGFTIIELLGTIMILALIMVIAVPSVERFANSMKKTQRENVIKEIEINAQRYAFDTGKTLFFAGDLVKYGYMDADDEDSNIIDPVTNKSLNCYAVKATKVKDHYTAKFIDSDEYVDSCTDKDLLDNSTDITITASKNGVNISEGENVSGATSITLQAHLPSGLNCIDNRCIWTSTRGSSVIGQDTLTITIDGKVDARYNFQITVKNNDGTLKNYQKSFHLIASN